MQMNFCSPLPGKNLQNPINLRITRSLIGIMLLLLYLLYVAISCTLRKSINNLRLQQQQHLKAEIKQKSIQYQVFQYNQQVRNGMGDHIIAVSFVLCFSPYQFEIFLVIIFLILKIIYEIRFHLLNQQTKILRIIFRIINLSLLICSMIGISRTQYNKNGCVDSFYNS